MNKAVSLALLVIGVILIIYGISASNSIGSEVSEAVTGSPTDRTIWLIAGGVLAAVVGLAGTLRRTRL